jgi:hypothetical protein
MVTTDKRRISRSNIASIPVLQLGGGGFVLSFPINSGDLGWVKASDRDISLFLDSYAETAPNTQRKHSFEDALFIPDVMMRGVTLADSDGVCLQSLNGQNSLVITDTEVKITAAEKITLTADEIVFDSPNVSMDGIRFDTHVHEDVQTGTSNSGQPTNP